MHQHPRLAPKSTGHGPVKLAQLDDRPDFRLAYTDWPFGTWGGLALLRALLLLLWRLSAHIQSPFAVTLDRYAGNEQIPHPKMDFGLPAVPPDRDKLKLFAVGPADDRTF